MANNYTYGTASYNGVNLRFIKTSPNNILPTYLNPPKSMTQSGYYGINGGFFNDKFGIVSIAAVNGKPVGGRNGDGTGGWTNGQYYVNGRPINLYRGTLVWDLVARKYSVPEVYEIDEIRVSDKSNYWAQGGVSMCLQESEDIFLETVKGQRLPEYNSKDLRSALVYNTDLNLWLVISTNSCTVSAFRTAIKNAIGSGTLVDGIFLDGGSSTSMRCADFYKNGNFLPEMLRLKDNS